MKSRIHVSTVKDRNRLASKHHIGELEHRHVWTPARPIDGEKTPAGGRDIVEVPVGARCLLVAELGRRVEANRVGNIVVLGERQDRVAAIDRARRSVDKILRLMVSNEFEDVLEADDVGLDVGHRILDGVAYPGLGRQM